MDLDSERALLQQCLLWESWKETGLGRARKERESLLVIRGRKKAKFVVGRHQFLQCFEK